MTRFWRGCAVAVAGVVASVALTGCALTGQVTVNADGTAAVDVVVTQAHEGDGGGIALCDEAQLAAYGLKGEPVTGGAGATACHVHGVTPQSSPITLWPFPVGQGDGRIFLMYPAMAVNDPPGRNPITDVDLTITFPGPVLETVGATEVDGSTARWTDPDRIFKEGFLAVALDHPDLSPVWTMALVAVGGLIVGAGGVLLVRRGVRRKNKPDAAPTAPAADADETPAEPALTTAPETPEPENPEVWATDG